MKIAIVPASEEDHKEIMKVAKLSPYTKDFSNSMMFSSVAAYSKGWIRIAKLEGTGEIVGFTCVRHKVRDPETVLYFIGVFNLVHSHGIGKQLMADLEEQTPHKRIALNVAKDNPRALSFYESIGFTIEHGDAIKGTANHLTKDL